MGEELPRFFPGDEFNSFTPEQIRNLQILQGLRRDSSGDVLPAIGPEDPLYPLKLRLMKIGSFPNESKAIEEFQQDISNAIKENDATFFQKIMFWKDRDPWLWKKFQTVGLAALTLGIVGLGTGGMISEVGWHTLTTVTPEVGLLYGIVGGVIALTNYPKQS